MGLSNPLKALRSIVDEFVARSPRMGAFYAMSPARVSATVQLWKTQLPTVKPFYAVKCNPDPGFLNLLFDSGVNFDCASERELISIRDLARANTKERVIYANPCKSTRDLVAAKGVGSPLTVVDSVEEVEKLAAAEYRGGALVRLAVDDTSSAMPFSSKFGAPCGMVASIAEAAKGVSFPLHGVAFHVGSGCKDGAAYTNAIRRATEAAKTLYRFGHKPAILDIGGGFLPNEADFSRKARAIRSALAGAPLFSTVWAEPGRFLAANSFDFFVQVIGKKSGPNGRLRFTVDDSVYGQFSNILFDQASPRWIRVGGGGASRPMCSGTLFGRTCDSLDVIAKSDCMEELEVGDWLWFPSMGAYTRATASEFNGFPTPEVMVLEPYQRLPELGFAFETVVPRRVTYPVRVAAELA